MIYYSHFSMADHLKFDFTSSSETSVNILLACTGSVAALKIPLLLSRIQALELAINDEDHSDDSNCKRIKRNIDIRVRVVTTEHAKHFFQPNQLQEVLYEDKDEWETWKDRKDPVLHIELRRWADIMLIAPLDANTLAKLATGICDNLLTCVVRAWDLKNKTLLFAPAMNTFMWEHPFTAQHISSLIELRYKEIPCIEKLLICGDKGLGAMAEVDTLVEYIVQEIKKCKNIQI